MINSIEDLKDRYGYRNADCCANCKKSISIPNMHARNHKDYRCYINGPELLDIVKVDGVGYCSSFERKR